MSEVKDYQTSLDAMQAAHADWQHRIEMLGEGTLGEGWELVQESHYNLFDSAAADPARVPQHHCSPLSRFIQVRLKWPPGCIEMDHNDPASPWHGVLRGMNENFEFEDRASVVGGALLAAYERLLAAKPKDIPPAETITTLLQQGVDHEQCARMLYDPSQRITRGHIAAFVAGRAPLPVSIRPPHLAAHEELNARDRAELESACDQWRTLRANMVPEVEPVPEVPRLAEGETVEGLLMTDEMTVEQVSRMTGRPVAELTELKAKILVDHDKYEAIELAEKAKRFQKVMEASFK